LNTTEHLLTILAEECAEVAQRATKALRFGLEEVQEGQDLTNAERLADELDDLLGVVRILYGVRKIRASDQEKQHAKMLKVAEYLEYSKERGTLRD